MPTITEARREQLKRAGIASGVSRRQFRADRGGHAPGHLREAFQTWVADDADTDIVIVGYAERERPLKWLLGKLWNCTDILPSMYCEVLEIPRGSTYARAVRAIKERMNAG